jgi:hypothetical protein
MLAHAEQAGFSPTNTSTSIFKLSNDYLVSKGTNYGSSSSPDWTYNWGTYWNRIMYSATWEPDGNATTSDVLSGKTFYSGLNNRTIQTGTVSSFDIDYSSEQYVVYDDNKTGDYEGEESEWINTNSTPGSEVWYDTRTETYWARSEPATKTNSFTISSCDFYTSTPRGSYGTSGTDPDCGNAINACADLSLASNEGESADTDWYLPSQKELKQAYRNGIYNQTTTAFTTASYFWSSAEGSADSSRAWIEALDVGYASNFSKANGYAVRCVRRD